MGLRIITNNKDKWEVFSSNTDSVIAEFTSEKDLKEFLALERIYKGKLEVIQLLMTFPQGWIVNDKREIISGSEEKFNDYIEWFRKINKDSKTYEEYYIKIDEKLEELMQ